MLDDERNEVLYLCLPWQYDWKLAAFWSLSIWSLRESQAISKRAREGCCIAFDEVSIVVSLDFWFGQPPCHAVCFWIEDVAFFAKGYDGMTMILIVWYCGVRRPQRALRSWPGLLLRLGCGKRSFMDFCYPSRRTAAGGAWQTFGHLWTQWSWKARAFTVCLWISDVPLKGPHCLGIQWTWLGILAACLGSACWHFSCWIVDSSASTSFESNQFLAFFLLRGLQSSAAWQDCGL